MVRALWGAGLALLLFASSSPAQPSKTERSIALTVDEWSYIGNLLRQRPWGEVNPLIVKMQAQLDRPPPAPLPEPEHEKAPSPQ